LGSRVQGLQIIVQGRRFRVRVWELKGLEFRVWGFAVQGSGFRDKGFIRVYIGLRVWG
jgi:hypothetical protein